MGVNNMWTYMCGRAFEAKYLYDTRRDSIICVIGPEKPPGGVVHLVFIIIIT